MGEVSAVYVYAGPKVWYSTRSTGGLWSDAVQYYGVLSAASPGETLASAASKLAGLISESISTDVYFIPPGGPPWDSIKITVTNEADPSYKGYWDSSRGPWWINGAWYILLSALEAPTSKTRQCMIKSVAYDGGDLNRPNSWTEMDQANAPKSTRQGEQARWDGTHYVDVLTTKDGSTNTWQLRSFDFDTDTWSAAYGESDFGGRLGAGYNSNCGNGIFRFPNGDIGVLYFYAFSPVRSVVRYRLYVAETGTWSAAVTVKDYGGSDWAYFCTMIPDPANESLHVFTTTDSHLKAAYHIVAHDGTVTADAFDWDPAYASEDGPGNGIIDGGNIYMPLDSEEENIIWVAPLTGGATTFVAETLPRPAEDTGSPSCASMFRILGTVTQANFAYFGVGGAIRKGASNYGFFV